VKAFKAYGLVLVIGSIVTIGSLSLAQDKSGAAKKTDSVIEGLVRDVACPIQNHKSTALEFSRDCALACAKAGSPVIILTKAGDIYFTISDQMPDSSQREKMMPFVGKYVRATGKVNERNGTRTIAIAEIKEMPEVKLNTGAPGK
jgi:hypothetical protein